LHDSGRAVSRKYRINGFLRRGGSIDQFRPRFNEHTCAINTESRCNNFAINKGLLEKRPLAIESSITSLILKRLALSLLSLERERRREVAHVYWNFMSTYYTGKSTFTRLISYHGEIYESPSNTCRNDMMHSSRKRFSVDNNWWHLIHFLQYITVKNCAFMLKFSCVTTFWLVF